MNGFFQNEEESHVILDISFISTFPVQVFMAAQFLQQTTFRQRPESSAFSSLGCAKEPYWKSPVARYRRDEA